MDVSINNNKVNYFLPGPGEEANRRASAWITKQLQNEFKGIFTGIGCFESIFSLQERPDSTTYQVPPRNVAYALQKPLKEDLKQLQ